MATAKCEICGGTFEIASTGRPRRFHPACGKVAEALSRLTAAVALAAGETNSETDRLRIRKAISSNVLTTLADTFNKDLAVKAARDRKAAKAKAAK
jgi:hypothetical protein